MYCYISISIDHMKRMQTSGQHKSLQSLTAMLLHDQSEEEDKYPSEMSE